MISVIVITFNSEKFIEFCLNSIFNQKYQDSEVIVVDNASTDGTLELVKKYPRAVLIANRENFGACRARNQGIEVSSGEWVLTLDCDVVLERDFLSKAVNVINSLSSDTGILQPKILNPDEKTIYSCGIHLSWMRRFYDIGRGKDNAEFNEPRGIFGACSACAFYKKEMLQELKEETGYFDERFFFLVEDVDLAWRAQKRGFKAVYTPELICRHKGNSSRANKKKRQYLCFRNRFYSIMKNEGITRYLIKVLPVLFYDIPRIFFLALTNRYVYTYLNNKRWYKTS